jgi:hypothetical protein
MNKNGTFHSKLQYHNRNSAEAKIMITNLFLSDSKDI